MSDFNTTRESIRRNYPHLSDLVVEIRALLTTLDLPLAHAVRHTLEAALVAAGRGDEDHARALVREAAGF